MTALLLYPLLCVALYYLMARATLTEALWSRYPAWLDRLTSCAACSGFWYGLGCAGLGWWQGWSVGGLPARDPVTVALVGLCSIVWTPLLAALHIRALERLSAPTSSEAAPSTNTCPRCGGTACDFPGFTNLRCLTCGYMGDG